MMLFDTGKRLEKAVGEEAAQIIIEAFEKLSEEQKKELATKGDLREEANVIRADVRETELRLQKEIEIVRKEIAQSKSETIRWTVGLMVAQTAAIIAALVAIIK